MSRVALSADKSGIVIFKFFPSLRYGLRMLVSFFLILIGLLAQWLGGADLIGGAVLLAGNVLLLVNGYNNQVDFGRFSPSAEWQKVEMNKLEEVKALQKKIRKWDISFLDITNVPGFLVFSAMSALLFLWFTNTTGLMRVLGMDAALLFVPHWLTGTRRILLFPSLSIKIEVIEQLLAGFSKAQNGDVLELMMLIKGRDGTHLPDDVKFKVTAANAHKDFLGLYGQVVINEVQGKSYPYFYVVLVARKGYGLRKVYRHMKLPQGLIREYKEQDEAEVIVIRQYTTSTSGYHTDGWVQQEIFRQGVNVMHKVATRPTS